MAVLTFTPRLPPGEVRVGGFGGSAELASWLAEHDVAAVVDATHPFAERISATAAAACARSGVPLLRLERPGWREQPGDRWHRVGDLREAAELVPRLGRRVWLTIGRQGVAAFAGVQTCWFLIRCIERPEPPIPPEGQIVLDRGPFDLDGGLALIDGHRIDVLVTKESGGDATEAKLAAARLRGLPVVVVRRPTGPGIASVTSVAEAVDWTDAVLTEEATGSGRPLSR
jgi:precorrin-6A/cobalt-precorrin-6A reductase